MLQIGICRLLLFKVKPQIYLWLAISIFGAANSVTRKLTEIGARHFQNDRNPISLCNVLFVGNLCALLVLLIIYRRQIQPAMLKRLSRRECLGLIVVSTLAGAIAPSLIFQALAVTNVNTVVFLGRLEPPLTLLLSVWLLSERVNFWEILGASIAFTGVISIIFLFPILQGVNNISLMLGMGEIFTIAAAIALATATILGKLTLSRVSLGIYSIFRTAWGTVIFFFAALLLYGRGHFMDVFSPFLWEWMLVYGSIIVVLGQTFWITGLRATSISEASLVSSFTPIAGILAAYFILGEVPTLAQYIGGSVIVIGVFLSQIGIRQKASIRAATRNASIQKQQEIESNMGFKGI